MRGLLGEAYALQGEPEEAQEAFEIALELTKGKKGKKKARVALARGRVRASSS